MKSFGDKDRLCFEVGDKKVGGLLPMEIYAAKESVTPFDKHAYLPSFIASLERELDTIKKGGIPEEFIYFNHGPTTDDVYGKVAFINNEAKLTFEFRGEKQVVVMLSVAELIEIYNEVIIYLRELNA
ncbi:hypothetical protein NBRC116493_02650 [Aurantivibrio infirmus]